MPILYQEKAIYSLASPVALATMYNPAQPDKFTPYTSKMNGKVLLGRSANKSSAVVLFGTLPELIDWFKSARKELTESQAIFISGTGMIFSGMYPYTPGAIANESISWSSKISGLAGANMPLIYRQEFFGERTRSGSGNRNPDGMTFTTSSKFYLRFCGLNAGSLGMHHYLSREESGGWILSFSAVQLVLESFLDDKYMTAWW